MLTVPRQGGRPLPVEAHLLLKTGTMADRQVTTSPTWSQRPSPCSRADNYDQVRTTQGSLLLAFLN